MSYESQRHTMVQSQLCANGVFNKPLLDLFRKIPRELFVSSSIKEVSYIDSYLPLSSDRVIMPPLMLAKILNEVSLKPTHTVLSIGGGSGYAGVLISYFVSLVFLVESESFLAKQAQKNIECLGIENIIVSETPLEEGLPQQAPFDVILIEGGVDYVPPSLLSQLTPDGILLTCKIIAPSVGKITLFKNNHNETEEKFLFEGYLPLMQAFHKEKEFEF